MTDVSIIIPSYNRIWCLPRAIESCRDTNCKTEIIVVDDGSNDGTLTWLEKQDNLVIISQKNQGQTYAVNAGTQIATGKYIRFLDSDDFLEKGIIDKQFQAAENANADLVYSRVDGYVEEEQRLIEYPEITEWPDFFEVQLSAGYGSHFLGMQFRTELVLQTPRRPEFALREDRIFLLEYCLLNPVIAFVPGRAGYWVKHGEQMQGNYNGMASQVANWQHYNIFKKILKVLEERNELTVPRKKAAATI
ncbi:MAG: glycosyltransferase, partial [Sphingobacteriales bacterium]